MPPQSRKPKPAPDEDPLEADVQRTIDEADDRLAAAEEGNPYPDPEPPAPDLPSEAELDARERELKLRERELALVERERALAEREAQASADVAAVQGEPGLPEYLLTLANGEQVEAPNPNASHHTGSDGYPWRVIRADQIPGKWGVPYAKHPDNPDNQQRRTS